MTSVKKIDKSRKSKATIARTATKSRRDGVKTRKRDAESKAKKARSASMPRTGRPTTKPAAKRATAVKAKAAARVSDGRGKASAAKVRTAARGRAAAKVTARKTVKVAAKAAKGRAKAAQASRQAGVKQAASRGKTRPGRLAAAQSKLPKAAVAPRQPTVSQSEAVAKKLVADRRARAEAMMALRSKTGKAAAAPHPRKDESNKAGVTQKIQKKVEAAPQPARFAVPAAAKNAAPSAAPIAQAPAAAKPASAAKLGFKPTEFVVYPAHGVGQILAVEEQEVAGFKLELFVISFAKDKMILKVPTPKTVSVGMRKLAGAEVVKHALNTLTGRARIKRTMWSRRAQEYEAKINSGDLVAIAEVVRDLYRSEAQPEQSYSERQLYEAALDRVAREIAVVHKLTETEALKLIESQLQKGPRRGKPEEIDGDAEAATADEGGIEEAA